jgi:5-bromo-4-chloroindolyl phosphate hydrolysis protein
VKWKAKGSFFLEKFMMILSEEILWFLQLVSVFLWSILKFVLLFYSFHWKMMVKNADDENLIRNHKRIKRRGRSNPHDDDD